MPNITTNHTITYTNPMKLLSSRASFILVLEFPWFINFFSFKSHESLRGTGDNESCHFESICYLFLVDTKLKGKVLSKHRLIHIKEFFHNEIPAILCILNLIMQMY